MRENDMNSKVARILLSVVIVSQWGCDSDSVTEPTTTVKTSPPKAGSTFTFNQVRLDSLGRKISGSDVTHTDSVAETGISIYGKSNVMMTVVGSFGIKKYYNFESNGDISEYVDYSDTPPLRSFWVTYPIQSIGAKTYTLIDTTVTVSGISSRITSKAIVSYEGSSRLPIYDSSLTMIKIKTVGVNTVTSSVQNRTDSLIAYYYFAPSIGYIAKYREEPSSFGDGLEQTLISFVLQ